MFPFFFGGGEFDHIYFVLILIVLVRFIDSKVFFLFNVFIPIYPILLLHDLLS